MSADLHSYVSRAAWPRSEVPGFAPLAATLMPEIVPPPPTRKGLGDDNIALAVVLAAFSVCLAVGLALAVVAGHYGWFG